MFLNCCIIKDCVVLLNRHFLKSLCDNDLEKERFTPLAVYFLFFIDKLGHDIEYNFGFSPTNSSITKPSVSSLNLPIFFFININVKIIGNTWMIDVKITKII